MKLLKLIKVMKSEEKLIVRCTNAPFMFEGEVKTLINKPDCRNLFLFMKVEQVFFNLSEMRITIYVKET